MIKQSLAGVKGNTMRLSEVEAGNKYDVEISCKVKIRSLYPEKSLSKEIMINQMEVALKNKLDKLLSELREKINRELNDEAK